MLTGPSTVSHCCCGVILSHHSYSDHNTKFIVLGDHAPPRFVCNVQPIELLKSFCYLGLHFHESGSVAHLQVWLSYSIGHAAQLGKAQLVKLLKAKTAGLCAMIPQKHAQLQCGDTLVSVIYVCLK